MQSTRRRLRLAVPALLMVFVATTAQAQSASNDLIDLDIEQLMEVQIIPIDVLGKHIHPKGEWMVTYQYMGMAMDGNRIGTEEVTVDEVLADYMVSPTIMSMNMHMAEVMYGLTDSLTLMAMMSYVQLEMDHVMRTGMRFTTQSEGLSDIELIAHWAFYQSRRHRFIYFGGLSLPTGSIEERGNTPMGNVVLPYPMQLGSGTYDVNQGVGYVGSTTDWSWGVDAHTTRRTGTNSREYTLGDVFETSAWLARRLTPWAAANVELLSHRWGNIEGADPSLRPGMVPTADPALRGGSKLDFVFGVSFMVPSGALKNNRLFIDGNLPVQRDLNGPQLQGTGGVRFGWEWRF